MRVHLEYGRTGLEVELPDERVVRTLAYKDAPPLADPQAELAQGARAAHRHAAAGRAGPRPHRRLHRHLRHHAAGAERADPAADAAHARSGRHPARQDHDPRRHRPAPARTRATNWSKWSASEIVDNYRIENHHGKVLDEHTYLGDSPRGVPVWIDCRYVEADLKITTGLIEPHLMAGFSGGRKLICPGIAALETVKVWHGPDFLEHPKADCGILDGNPVHEENTWIGRHAGCDFIVNVVIDGERRPLSSSPATWKRPFSKASISSAGRRRHGAPSRSTSWSPARPAIRSTRRSIRPSRA